MSNFKVSSPVLVTVAVTFKLLAVSKLFDLARLTDSFGVAEADKAEASRINSDEQPSIVKSRWRYEPQMRLSLVVQKVKLTWS